MNKTLTHVLLVALLSAVLSACGGGDDDPSEVCRPAAGPYIDEAQRPIICGPSA